MATRSSSRRVELASRVALASGASYYLVTQVVRTSRFLSRSKRDALEALSLGDLGRQAVIPRRPDLIALVERVLSTVSVTPLLSAEDPPAGVTPERPESMTPVVPLVTSPTEHAVLDLYSVLRMEEADPRTEGSPASVVDVVRDVGRRLDPNLPTDEFDRGATEIVQEMLGGSQSIDDALERESGALALKLEGWDQESGSASAE